MKMRFSLLKTLTVFLLTLMSSIVVSAQGNVGISVPTPINTLDIHRGTARTNTHNGGNALYITGGAEFRSADATTGLKIGSNDIVATGANTNVDLSLASKGSTGSITFKANGIERARITGSGIGIGTTTPNAPLQFSSLYENRKIVLVETAFNNHQYYGFGVNGNALRYQTDATASDHVFYAAVDASSSNELMRIKGNGNVGIGTNLPNAPLQFSIAAANRKIVMYEAANNDHQFIGFGQNLTSLRYQVNGSASDHIFYAGASTTTSTELMRIKGNGILRFPSTLVNRKIVLYQDGVDNDHQYVGFGVNAGLMRHQVPNTSDSHVFYAGTSTTTSNELMRIKGNGKVGINGVTNPNAELHLSNAITNRKIILYEGPANDHQFYGLGVNTGIMRYQVAAPGDNHVFYAAANGTSSNELMRIQGNGNVGIGTPNPGLLLDVNGNARVLTHLHVGSGAIDSTQELNVVGDARISGTLEIGYVITSETFYLEPLEDNQGVFCDCPVDYRVVGGGYQAQASIHVTGSLPQALGIGWTIIASNDSSGQSIIHIHAICMKVMPE